MKGKIMMTLLLLMMLLGCDNSLKEGEKIVINGEVHIKTNGEFVKVSLYK